MICLEAEEASGVAAYEKVRLCGCCHCKEIIIGWIRQQVYGGQLGEYERPVQTIDERAEFPCRYQSSELWIAACASQFGELNSGGDEYEALLAPQPVDRVWRRAG